MNRIFKLSFNFSSRRARFTEKYGAHNPFKKENCEVKYINNQSNHPKVISRGINPIKSSWLNKLISNNISSNSRKNKAETMELEKIIKSGFKELKECNNSS